MLCIDFSPLIVVISILPYCNVALFISSKISQNTSIGRRDRKTSNLRISLLKAVGSSQTYRTMSIYLTLLNDARNFTYELPMMATYDQRRRVKKLAMNGAG